MLDNGELRGLVTRGWNEAAGHEKKRETEVRRRREKLETAGAFLFREIC